MGTTMRRRKIGDEAEAEIVLLILKLADEGVRAFKDIFIDKVVQIAAHTVWFHKYGVRRCDIEDILEEMASRELLTIRCDEVFSIAKVKEYSLSCYVSSVIASAPQKPNESPILDDDYDANRKTPLLLQSIPTQRWPVGEQVETQQFSPIPTYVDSCLPSPFGAFVPLERGFGLYYDPFYNSRKLWGMLHPADAP